MGLRSGSVGQSHAALVSGLLGRGAGSRQAPHELDLLFRGLFTLFAGFVSMPLISIAAGEEWPVERVAPLSLVALATVMVALRAPAALSLVALLSAIAISIASATEPQPVAPRLLLGIAVFLIALELRAVVAIRALLTVGVLYVALALWVGPAGYGWAAVDDTMLTVGVWLAGAVFLDSLLRSGQTARRIHQDRLEAELASKFAVTHTAITSSMRRLLHDEVIGTLNAIADHGSTCRPLGACPVVHRLRDDCERVAQSLVTHGEFEGHSAGTLDDLVEKLSRRTLVSIKAQGPQDVHLDSDQADAVGRALGEALRNVARHTDTRAAEVWWHEEHGEVCLSVRDDGPAGLTPGRAVAVGEAIGGFGLRSSVAEPLATIGGRAALLMSNGGSIMTMRWPVSSTSARKGRAVPALDAAHSETRRAIADQQGLVLRVAIPILFCNGWIALRYSWGDAYWLEQLLLAVAVIVGTIGVGLRIRLAPLPPVVLVVLALGVASVVHVQILLAGGPETLRDYNSYMVGLAATVLTICAFYVPLGWALIVAGPLAAVVVGHAIVGDLSLGESGGAFVAALIPPLLGYVFGAYLRRSRQRQDVEEHRLKDLAAEAHRKERQQALAGAQLSRARGVVGPWLKDLSTGERDVHDADIAEHARAYALSLRDDLHVPGILDAVLSARIDLARRNGLEVVLEAADGEPLNAAPCLRLLDRLLDCRSMIERIQVRLPERGRPSALIMILPPPDAADLERALTCLHGWPHEVRYDDFAALVTIHDLHGSNDAFAEPP